MFKVTFAPCAWCMIFIVSAAIQQQDKAIRLLLLYGGKLSIMYT